MYKKSIADLAYDILEENHRPMHYRRITEEVIKMKKIKAENLHHDVNALMGSDQRFIKYQRGIWGLVKWKYREANSSYTLTSYCLRNGTIFLTSYLKPYFSWTQDDHNIEIIFVDIDGEEINALVNYRQKLIFGLKEWFQKRKLDVNDALLIGLIDKDKRKYFIIAEKDTKLDTEKDIGDTILQIIKEAGKPISFSQIYESIIKQDLGQRGLFDEYIKNTLRNDTRYVEIQKDRWGLFEWLNETDQISLNLIYAENVDDFLSSLKRCFEFLGYSTEWFEGYEQKLFVARAALNYKSYSLLITGLPKNYNINMVQAINWPGIKKVKESVNTDSVMLFSEKFVIRELIDRASEEGVQLYDTFILNDLVKEHQRIPFSLFELNIAFSPMHHPRSNIDKLMEIRNKQWKKWNLIKEIVSILQIGSGGNTSMDFHWLMKELNLHGKNFSNEDIDQIEVKKIIEQFSQEPFKMIELSELGSMMLSFPYSMVQKRIHSFLRFIMEKKEYDIVDHGRNVES